MTYLLISVILFMLLLGILMLKRSKKIAIALFILPILFILVSGSWLIFEKNYHFVKNTNLSKEVIDDIALYASLEEYQSNNKNIQFSKGENVYYPTLVKTPSLRIGANKKGEILYVSTKLPKQATSKNIKVTDSKDEVIKKYGGSYYTGIEMGIGKFIAYVDRDSKRHIRFWLEDEQVKEIEFQELK
ncbi:hypothetical protein V7052_26475 [Bacillus wiedmannii]|uniref:hypothetical protein n=1 Tax=Bacillus wiedmannii TaxID=1890302 RepID=UPI002FFE149F